MIPLGNGWGSGGGSEDRLFCTGLFINKIIYDPIKAIDHWVANWHLFAL